MEDSGIDSGDHNLDESSSKQMASDSSSTDSNRSLIRLPLSGPKYMHRKLECHFDKEKKSNADYNQPFTLIPIQRLPIPGVKDRQLLVEWDSDSSEEDIVNFFPQSKRESRVHHELTDTFSIEEMSISGDDDYEEDLHLVPPASIYKNISCCTTNCVIL